MQPHYYEQWALEEMRLARQIQLANKLIDGLQRLQEKYPDSQKRWIWELLQNALDACSVNSLRVQIDMAEDRLVFRHNGRPFLMKEIVDLIEQTSSKSRMPEEDTTSEPSSIGHYGTGFMTTHLLSRKITVSSVFYDEKLDLYRRFTLRLDRSPGSQQTMLEKVQESFLVFKELDESSSLIENYEPYKELDTVFTYELKDSESLDTARKGIGSLEELVHYVLVFNKKLKQVVLNLDNETKTFCRLGSKSYHSGTLHEIQGNSDQPIYLFKLQENAVTICVELEKRNGKYIVKQQLPTTPSIFVNLPLIGSEQFEFPFVVHSHLFMPNEERSYVPLSRTKSSALNRDLVLSAFRLHIKAFISLKDLSGIEYLAFWQLSGECQTIQKFQQTLRNNRKLICANWKCETYGGDRQLLKNLVFVFETDVETSIQLITAILPFLKHHMPNIQPSQYLFWKKLIESFADVSFKPQILDLSSCVRELAKYNNLSHLDAITRNTAESVNSLNIILQLKCQRIQISEYKIFPNQYGKFCKAIELYKDQDIPEILKDIAKSLGQDFRSVLLYRDIDYNLSQSLSVYDVIKFINSNLTATHIQEIIKLSCIHQASGVLNSRRALIFAIAQSMSSEKVEPIFFENWDESLNIKSDQLLSQIVFDFIESCPIASLESLAKRFNNPLELVCSLISAFEFDASKRKIFPSKSGHLKHLSELKESTIIDDLKTAGVYIDSEAIEGLLVSLLDLTGYQIDDYLIHPAIGAIIASPGKYSVSDAIHNIGRFIGDKNNYSHQNFSSIFKILQTLDETHNFKMIQEYQKNKAEMFYQIIDEQKKLFILENVNNPDFIQKYQLIKNIDTQKLIRALRIVDQTSTQSQSNNPVLISMRLRLAELCDQAQKPQGLSITPPAHPSTQGVTDSFNRFMTPIRSEIGSDIKEYNESNTLVIPDPFLTLKKNTSTGLPIIPLSLEKRGRFDFSFNNPSEMEQIHEFENRSKRLKEQTSIGSSDSCDKLIENNQVLHAAVKNFVKYLRTRPNYDIETAATPNPKYPYILHGVKYKGEPVNILVKKVTDHHIRIKCERELKHIRKQGSQLWAMYTDRDPVQVTFGDLFVNADLIGRLIPVKRHDD